MSVSCTYRVQLCSCTDKNKPQCQGKDYHTREVLSCPFHLLVYKIECHIRAKMADQLVDSTLTLELLGEFSQQFPAETYERLHYHVAINLGLFQANQTHEYSQEGPAYHWKIDLLQCLYLPVVQQCEGSARKLRSKWLDALKTTKAMKS